MDIPEFKPFDKVARWSRPVVVTEKIDGTNGVIWISDGGNYFPRVSRLLTHWYSYRAGTDSTS